MTSTKTNKVVTITLNPALDLTGSVEALKVGSVSLVKQSNLHAAGKGVNVAKVLSDLGADVTVTGFLGKDNPELFHQLFAEIDVKDEFIEVEGSTRINVKLVESNGEVSDINFPGVQVTAEDIARFEDTLFRLAETHDYFVLAGSLPGGVTPELCAAWIEKLHQLGKKVLFDSSKAALSAGIDAHPWLIKPNDEELSDFVGQHLETPEQCQQAAQSLADKGIENIVVSMGANGVMWLNQGEWLRAQPPRMNVVSTVGAGDTLVAGLCWGHMQVMPKNELLRFATALSALAVSQVGVGLTSQEELENIKLQTQVSELNSNTNLDNN
ncbi:MULTISPECIES: 1-phosphofructokinase [Vibrio]|jgi:1-phosphofructokinase|uniref:Phosphofructokinase n=1 Tax=Vibrio natriegens NBRC 15636 = ATCC 14048 = DSM 759 TaxID=1219067 RepID=A0AAN0Y5P6_VIBNA|nr:MULTISPECIES: 1-phosphofructokinase [Vibrio]MEE3876847.1 1-phosphofructokinase [Vibrio sp. YYF0003]AEX24450.1 1-phosphofructokinase [Vibrio sp. EJY3]ALR18392.1 1-phosphofructokinase [Vibrio natriegens NBRC 15636 = ATCC 14048 = DSM 759]ANQ14339.1 1-phosphofructokinase [Vibrio natriegens NBRC 15636 = ATCC 14048 = DSM 759]ANQ24281.1 1-phosphofructokinase [Vibrio natriegens]